MCFDLCRTYTIYNLKINIFTFIYCVSILEKGAENPALLVVPPIPNNVNKWAGEDEDDVKVIHQKLKNEISNFHSLSKFFCATVNMLTSFYIAIFFFGDSYNVFSVLVL